MSQTETLSLLFLRGERHIESVELGAPNLLSPGVSIRFMPQTSEGLLEVDGQIGPRVQVDGRLISEIATVHPGQVVDIGDQRLVVVKHLQAILIPRSEDERAQTTFAELIQSLLADISADEEVVAPHSVTPQPKAWRKWLLRGIAVGFVGLVTALALVTPDDESMPVAAVPVAAAERALEVPAETHVAAVVASPQSVASPVAAVASKRARRVAQASEAQPSSALTAKERQTVLECKLEARFDRGTAAAKLRQFAETFPAGSAARAEVLRASRDL